MKIQITGKEVNRYLTNLVSVYAPDGVSLNNVQLTDEGCTLHGGYKKVINVNWSLDLKFRISDDGKRLGVVIGEPALENRVLGFCAKMADFSPKKLQSMILDGVSEGIQAIDWIRKVKNTVWLDLSKLFPMIGLGRYSSSIEFMMSESELSLDI